MLGKKTGVTFFARVSLILLATLAAERAHAMDLSALEKKEKGGARRPRGQEVKDKTVVPVQITADLILHDVIVRQEAEIRPPRQRITDGTELEEFRNHRRQLF